MLKVLDEELKNLISDQRPKGVARCRREPNGSYTIFSNRFYKHLNETAGMIYSRLNGENSVADILEFMKKSYPNADESTLLKDIVLQIRAMQKIGLVTRQAIPLG